jgi:hypothetical protein
MPDEIFNNSMESVMKHFNFAVVAFASMLTLPVMAEQPNPASSTANVQTVVPFANAAVPMMGGMPMHPNYAVPGGVGFHPGAGPMPMMGVNPSAQGPQGMGPNPQMMRHMMQSHMAYLRDMEARIQQLEAQIQELQKR